MTEVYVLQTTIIHDETYVEGVTLSQEVAEKWVEENPFIPFSDQREWRQWTSYTPLEELDSED